MRILVVSNVYPPTAFGGYEVECSGVVDHLRAQGHDVTVLTSTKGEAAPGEAGIRRELPFVAVRKADSVRAPYDAVRAVRVARRVLAEVRPELVYVWNGAAIPQVAIRELALAGLPLAFRVCEHWFGRLYEGDVFLRHLEPGETGLRGAWARAMRAVDRVDPALRTDLRTRTPAAVSWNAEFMKASVPVPPSIEVVHDDVLLPVNPRVPRFGEVRRAPAHGDPVVFFAGRLDDRKGADVAVRALARLRDEHGLDARLVLAGQGPERASLVALASSLGVGDRIELPGPLDFDAMAARLSTAAAWIVPSVWDEPAPTVALEAALAQVPAVLSRVGGTPEVLREEQEALFFGRGDDTGAAAALARVLGDPEETAARTARAHTRAHELSYEHYLAATDRFLADALAALQAHRAST